MNRRHVLLAALVLLSSARAHADEGMWLVNAFPSDRVRQAYGTAPTADLLGRLQRGAVRLADGCSASFVSARGLVMTNHHCVRACLATLSIGRRDLLQTGFLARRPQDELRCDTIEANQLVRIEDVSARVLAAVKGLEGAAFHDRLRAEEAAIEEACNRAETEGRCDVVSLWDGAAFHLYVYRRFRDVRVVFAPEFAAAIHGGDPDNFNFPRYGFDAAFLRVWRDGKPWETADALPLADHPVAEGDLVYVAGHPGGTERERTATQLELQRDVALPWRLLRLAELRGRLDEWIKANPSRLVIGRTRLRAVENSLKALRGRHQALSVAGLFEARRAADAALAAQSPAARAALAEIDAAAAAERRLWSDHAFLEDAEGFDSELFEHARVLVRHAAEKGKPNAERLPELTDARFPPLAQKLASTMPVPLDVEIATLGWSLERMRNLRGADDPVVRQVLGTRRADVVARQLIMGSRLRDPRARVAALEGRLDLSADPLIQLARAVDAQARAVRLEWEREVDDRETRAADALAAARRNQRGTAGPPDATFTLRISYGAVKGTAGAPAMTTIGGLLDRAGDSYPFALVPSWSKARARLRRETPMDLATTNDIIGGNSGSPLVDKDGRVVGLIFDGNLASLGGRFFYDGTENRAVAVSLAAMLEALDVVYGARELLAELGVTASGR